MEDDLTNNIAITSVEEEQSIHLLSQQLTDSKSIISNLSSQIAGLSKENSDLSNQILELKDHVKGFDSVLARAASLEGDVVRLQDDLVSAMFAVGESSTEIKDLKTEKQILEKRVEELEDSVRVKDKNIVELEAAVDQSSTVNKKLEVEKLLLSGKVKELEDSFEAAAKNVIKLEEAVKEGMKAGENYKEMVSVLQEKLGKVKTELEDKEIEIGKVKGLAADAISEVEILQRSMVKMMDSEIVNEEVNSSALDEEKKKAIEDVGIGFKCLPFAATAVSVGIVSVATTVFFMRNSRDSPTS